MNVPNLMSKAFSYQDLRSGGHYVRPTHPNPPPPPPPIVPQGMIRQEYPGADRVKTKFRKQGLI